MFEQPIELSLVKIQLMSKMLSLCISSNSNIQISVAHYTKKDI
jgi:hypothetical protein